MKTSKIIAATLSIALFLTIQTRAQTMFQITYRAMATTTNDSGAIVSQSLNNASLVQDAMTVTGTSNASRFMPVYVQSASSDPSQPGDFIEVVNKTNGIPVYTNLQFMYNGSFPPALTNAAGNQIVIGAQVIPLPLAIGDSLGGATINERMSAKGTMIEATFNYTLLRTASGTNTITAINGSLSGGKVFTPK